MCATDIVPVSGVTLYVDLTTQLKIGIFPRAGCVCTNFYTFNTHPPPPFEMQFLFL
jgi:hypothetical protein